MGKTGTNDIASLSPTEFENLTYDTLSAIGFKNLVWRTPGADGGRDIEGQASYRDPTGHESLQIWYIECKKYQSSIDWPTVWQKISYAESNGADVLLLSTNSTPSPNCETHISQWNASRKIPKIRVWRGYEWKTLLRDFSDIASAYGLYFQESTNDAVGPVASILTKIVQTAYVARSIHGSSTPALETAAAVSELIDKRLTELTRYGKFVDVKENFIIDQEILADASIQPPALRQYDELSVRAAMYYVAYITGQPGLIIETFDERSIKGNFSVTHMTPKAVNTVELGIISRWTRLHIHISVESSTFEITNYEQ